MSRKSTEMTYANLGECLRDARLNLGIDLTSIAEETKISPKSLQAMEENNFASLPAEAFTRGFYTLYAKRLALDGKEILKMYMQQRPKQHKSGSLSALLRIKLANEVGTMAERPAFKPVSFLGLVMLLLLLFGGFLCWYFSWNPATYLSQKLRSLEQPQQIEQASANRSRPTPLRSGFRFPRLYQPQPNSSDLFSLAYPSIATEAIAQDMPDGSASPRLQNRGNFTAAELAAKKQLPPSRTAKGISATDHAAKPQQ